MKIDNKKGPHNSGQITIIHKPELRAVFWDSLTKPPFGVTNRRERRYNLPRQLIEHHSPKFFRFFFNLPTLQLRSPAGAKLKLSLKWFEASHKLLEKRVVSARYVVFQPTQNVCLSLCVWGMWNFFWIWKGVLVVEDFFFEFSGSFFLFSAFFCWKRGVVFWLRKKICSNLGWLDIRSEEFFPRNGG